VIIAKLLALADEIIKSAGAPLEKIMGLGVGMPGLLDPDKGLVIFSPDFHWENVDLLAPIRQRHKMTIAMENSNRTMALGEKWFGAAQGSDYFICVNLGHGIGSAIIEDGDIYHGSSGSSGEFGHITLERNGPVCDCGNQGCLEVLASGNAIASRAREAATRGLSAEMLRLADGQLDLIDAKVVFEAAKLGDSVAKRIVDTAIEYIGIGLASYINLLDPDLVILGGGLVNAGDALLDGIKSIVRSKQMKHAGRKVRIKIGALGQDASAIGAASLILKSFIDSGGDILPMAK
jgi:glucokinase-like ROK family protein